MVAHFFSHVHLKSPNPKDAAQWYVDMFGAVIVREGENRGAQFVGIQLGGVTINISSARPEESLAPAMSELRWGLEHIAFGTDDLEGDLARLKQRGGKVFQVTETGQRKTAFVEGPDKVRIELMQG
jgi:lactoylglutathione lyase